MKYVTRETGNLLRDSVEPRPDAVAMTVCETGSGKRGHDAMVAQPTASNGWRLGFRHGPHDQRQATQRRNSSGSYGRKRPRQGTVTRGDDVSTTSVRPTHSVAPISTRRRRTWTAARQPVHRQLQSILSSAAAHTRTAARQLARPATLGLTVRQLRWRLLGYFHSPTQLSFLSSVLITLSLGYTTTVSQFINSTESFYAAVSQSLYSVTISVTTQLSLI